MNISKTRVVKTPTRSTTGSAGLDFYIPEDFSPCLLFPQEDVIIPSGIKAKVPKGYALMAAEVSEMATSRRAKAKAKFNIKKGTASSLTIGAKVIDEDYQGEIHIHVVNTGTVNAMLTPGMRIAQFLLIPVLKEEVKEVPERELFTERTERGERGFGEADNDD